MVMGRMGAWGRRTRVWGCKFRWGMMGAKSCPSAPSPCSQRMLWVALFLAGCVIRFRVCVIMARFFNMILG